MVGLVVPKTRDKSRPKHMDLLEYQGKELFARHGLPVPDGAHAATIDEAVAAADGLGYPVAVKAQVLIGGRGKAGGIKIAADAVQAHEHAGDIVPAMERTAAGPTPISSVAFFAAATNAG